VKLEELRAKVREWDRQYVGIATATSHFECLLNQLEYHATREWRVYLPAEHPDFTPSYLERLAAWIGNVSDEADQKLLLEYAECISFFSHDDFAALYSTALNRAVIPWVAAQSNVGLEQGIAGFQSALRAEIHRKTWFCPVTDSMDINEFYKVNHLTGIGHRPGFATLQMLAETAGAPNPGIAANLIAYMGNPSLNPAHPSPSLKRLVLLEDVVGSGSQCINAVKWAVTNLKVPVLFVPLILCPNGAEALDAEAAHLGGLLTVHPVIELRRCDLLGPERHGQQGWQVQKEAIEDLATRCAPRASQDMDTFGYRTTGCSVVTFSNTPDNTLPIIHNKPRTGNWEPLFPRVYRD
jgi:hypothetical protein